MITYLKRNSLGNSTFIALIFWTFIVFKYFLNFLVHWFWMFVEPVSVVVIVLFTIPTTIFINRYILKRSVDEQTGISVYNYHKEERIVLVIVGVVLMAIHYLAFFDIIRHYYSDYVAAGMYCWSVAVLTRNWKIWERIIWTISIVGLFVFISTLR